MPGPSGRMCTCTPEPWQVEQVWRLPDLLPVPLHLLQGSLRDRDSFLQAITKQQEAATIGASRPFNKKGYGLATPQTHGNGQGALCYAALAL